MFEVQSLAATKVDGPDRVIKCEQIVKHNRRGNCQDRYGRYGADRREHRYLTRSVDHPRARRLHERAPDKPG